MSAPIAFKITAPPMIQAVNPALARAGGTAVAIQVTASGFTSQSVVTWSGTPLATSFVSATQLKTLYPKDPHIAIKALEMALHYRFPKPMTIVAGPEEKPPIKIDISAIPQFRKLA